MFWKLNLRNNPGLQAENQALRYLKQQGLKSVARNFACKSGEIDLIMLDNEKLIFIEVRFRSKSNFGSAAQTINHHKQTKIRKTAAVYLQNHRQHNHRICRFDVIAIDNSDAKCENTLKWIKNAF
ncbi:YraN family protein [uncultured Endozoicomonas sp.]|uniref:YraN family protein n=1 Tax=uncultured Endozoicomonas sp. TaxID=432652 RepID=UPI002630CC81|nr:YraN family protein [uncultured Endozoicomonas sp.]